MNLGEKQMLLKEKLFDAYSWLCAIEGCCNEACDMHHIIEQTKVNRKKYPHYIDSPFNLFPICHPCHMTKPLPKKPSKRLVQLYEDYLASNVTSRTSLK